jgi:putative nucleotidyltransferase with HDIG domain
VKFEFRDESATQARISAAVDGVGPVYDLDAGLSERQQQRILSAYEQGRGAYAEALAAAVDESGEPIDLDPTVLNQLGAGFVEELGLDLRTDEQIHLARSGFSSDLQDLTLEMVAVGLRGYVVADRSVLPRRAQSVTVIRLNGDKRDEITLDSFDDVRTVDEARQDIALYALEHYGGRDDSEAELVRLSVAIARSAVRSNFSDNQLMTEDRRHAAATTVAPVVLSIDRGTAVVRDGDVVSQHQLDLVKEMMASQEGRSPWAVVGSLFAFCLLLCTSVYWFARAYIRKFSALRRDIEALGLLLVFTVLLARLIIEIGDPISASNSAISARAIWYLVPVAGSALLVRILINSETSLVFGIVAASLCGLMMEQSAIYTVFFIISSVIAAGAIGKRRERSAILQAGVFTGLLNAAFVLLMSLVEANLVDAVGGNAAALAPGWAALFAFLGGILSAFLVLGLVPLFELVGFDTDLKLLELGNLDHPLLRNLMLRAPGSYHHSVMVGTLAEAAAEAIGANALLCRVCSYFHDIGKAVRPQYFVENQRDDLSRHSRLTPHQSARVIIDHVRDGVEIASKHKLPRPIVDNIAMHHGTGLVHYFYRQALAESEDGRVDPADFTYPGPRPNTREAGVIMLADKIEAACRSIREPTPELVAAMIQKIINSVLSEGQFDECPLTVAEIRVIAEVFQKTVLAIHHHRIEYPDPPATPSKVDGKPLPESSQDEPVITLELNAREVLEQTSDRPIPPEPGSVDYEAPEHLPGFERDP